MGDKSTFYENKIKCSIQPRKNSISLAIELNNAATEFYDSGEHGIAHDLYNKSLEALLKTETSSIHSNTKSNIPQNITKSFINDEAYKNSRNAQERYFENTSIHVGLYCAKGFKRDSAIPSHAIKLSKRKSYQEYCLIVMFNISLLYIQEGLNKCARNILEDNLCLDSILINDLELMTSIYNMIGCLNYKEGDFGNALVFFVKAKEIVQHCGRSDRSKLKKSIEIILSNIGRTYYAQGQYDDAICESLELLQMKKLFFGDDHVDVCISMYNLGLIYQSKKETDQATKYFTCFINHPTIMDERYFTSSDIVEVLLNILMAFHYKNDKFVSFLRKAQRMRYNNGYDHPSIPNLLSDIGTILLNNCLYQFALPFFYEQLRLEIMIFGYQPRVASTLYDIGQTYQGKNDFLDAIKSFEEALELMEQGKIRGKIYAFTLFNMASINIHNNLFSSAMKQFGNALNVLRSDHGEYHSVVAEMLQDIGDVLLEHGRMNEAFNYFMEALTIRRLNYGNKHHIVAKTLCQIGSIHQSRGEFGQALNAYDQALVVKKEINLYKEASTVEILDQIGKLNRSKGDNNKAIIVYKEILNIIAARLGEHHISITYILNVIGSLYTEIGMIDQGAESYRKSKCLSRQLVPFEIHSDDEDFENTVLSLFRNFQCCPSSTVAVVA